jgi:hypothetical protein
VTGSFSSATRRGSSSRTRKRSEAERSVIDSLNDARLTGEDLLHQVVEVSDADGSLLFSVEFRKVLWRKDGP